MYRHINTHGFFCMKFCYRLFLLLVIGSSLLLGILLVQRHYNINIDVQQNVDATNVLRRYIHNTTVQLLQRKEPDKNWKEWNIPSDPSKIQIRGKYRHTQFTITSSYPKDESYTVCLATQTTLNWLHHIVEVADSWKGRMSVAVYVPGLEFTRTKIMLWLLYTCTRLSSFDIDFHFVFPSKQPAVDNSEMWEGITGANCSDIDSVGETLAFRKGFLSYPQNLMRNIAREACGTEYVILSDNDMIPTPGLSSALLPVLKQQRDCTKCAFVIPVYEIEDSIDDLPANKEQLVKLIKVGNAQAFHWKFWRPNQGSHSPRKWEKIHSNEGVQIAYPIFQYNLFYEPIYVAKRPLPLFNEDFTGYGFTRSSQVFEMVMKGYRFFVLDNAFFRHRGVKPRQSNPKWRNKETHSNFQVFIKFAKKLLREKGQINVINQMEKSGSEKPLSRYVKTIDNFHSKDVVE